MDANLNHAIHKEPQLVHVGPSKVEETFAVESVEGSKKGRRRIIPLGQWLPKITVDACVAPNVVLSDAGQTGQQREIQLRWS